MKEARWARNYPDEPQPVTTLSDADLYTAAYSPSTIFIAEPGDLATLDIIQDIAKGVIRMRQK